MKNERRCGRGRRLFGFHPMFLFFLLIDLKNIYCNFLSPFYFFYLIFILFYIYFIFILNYLFNLFNLLILFNLILFINLIILKLIN